MAGAAPPGDGLLWDVFKTVGGMLVGVAVTITSLRVWRKGVDGKIANHDSLLTNLKNDRTVQLMQLERRLNDRVAELETEFAAWRRQNDRRQIFILEVLSDIANKVGADQRMNDLTIRLLHNENDGDSR